MVCSRPVNEGTHCSQDTFTVGSRAACTWTSISGMPSSTSPPSFRLGPHTVRSATKDPLGEVNARPDRTKGDRMTSEAWIVEAVRTPVGRYGGALSSVRTGDLRAIVLLALVERAGGA